MRCWVAAAAAVFWLLILTASSTASRDQENATNAPELQQDLAFLRPPTDSAERASFIEWLISFLVNKPTKPPPPALPEPIDQSKCPPCRCGITNKQQRIVGGHVTYVNQYPWMALLLYRGKFYCGATLVNSLYVMTASHCIHGFKYEYISVRVYEHDRDTDDETKHYDRKAARIIGHSAYDEFNFNNDIALVKLNEPVPIENDLRPVCMPPAKKSFSGETGLVTGWGVTKTGGSTSSVLQEVQVPIMTNKECRNSSYGSSRITENMMCAGYKEGKKDSCQGDSGGPMHVIGEGGIHHVVGVVSWGEGCAQANHPGVYTRVNRYLTWIQKNTRDACYCQQTDEVQENTTAASPSTSPPSYSSEAPETSSYETSET